MGRCLLRAWSRQALSRTWARRFLMPGALPTCRLVLPSMVLPAHQHIPLRSRPRSPAAPCAAPALCKRPRLQSTAAASGLRPASGTPASPAPAPLWAPAAPAGSLRGSVRVQEQVPCDSVHPPAHEAGSAQHARTHARLPRIIIPAHPTSRSKRVGMSHASRMSPGSPVISAKPVPANKRTRAPLHALLPLLLLLLLAASAAAAAEAMLHWLP